MKTYCPECDNDIEVELLEREVKTTIDKVTFKYLAKIAYCMTCGNEVYIAEISDQNLKLANDKYRELAGGLIKVAEIQELLETYEIGKKPLASLLGWGEATIIRYLDGFTPRKIYSDQLKELKDPNKMLELFESNKKNLSEVAQRKLLNRINQLVDDLREVQDNGVVNVAKYFLSKIDTEAEEVITPLKLQKIIYYAQAWLLALKNRTFFEDDFQAWVHGPVIPNLYYQYKKHGYSSIPKAEAVDSSIFDEDQLNILEMVRYAYGRYDAKYLEELTHQESPWKDARGECKADEICTRIISKDSIKSYFDEIADNFNIQSKHDLKNYIASL